MLKLATKFRPRPATFEAAHRAGFRNAEFWLDAKVLADWRAVVPLARHYPLEYVPHFPNQLNLTNDALEHAAALYRALGCRCLVIHQEQADVYGERLLWLEPTMRLAIENHLLDPAGLERWAEESPGLTLDVEHLWKYTLHNAPLPRLVDEVQGFLNRHASKLRHVHLPGYLPGFREHRPMYCSREMVFAVWSLLREHDFDGLIVSEVGPEFQNANDLRMDVLLFETWRDKNDPHKC
jgi:sugar phosphate isomerase/epimerase